MLSRATELRNTVCDAVLFSRRIDHTRSSSKIKSFYRSYRTGVTSTAVFKTMEDISSSESPSMVDLASQTNKSFSLSPNKTIHGNNARAIRTSDIIACAQHLVNGGLVAFPTETVYGLGCNALDSEAIQAVFDAKERPLTDPLIVHVLTASDAFRLWAATCPTSESTTNNNSATTESRILSALCDAFWPGPLTLVALAAERVVPHKIMAGTGYCAVRSPRHNTARDLLKAAQVPLAAPSANKFGHVSPTTADHVWNDLHGEDVWILEDSHSEENKSLKHTVCDVGVESTVAKVEQRQVLNSSDLNDNSTFVVTVLRQGAVSVQDLNSCLINAGLVIGVDVSVAASGRRQVSPYDVGTVAPGQLLRHYSPNVPSFLVSQLLIKKVNLIENEHTGSERIDLRCLEKSVILDYGGQLLNWKDVALAYHDLSPSGHSIEAAQTVFDTLRWAEQVSGAERILFPDFAVDTMSTDALTLAIKDRLTRAASGAVIDSLEY